MLQTKPRRETNAHGNYVVLTKNTVADTTEAYKLGEVRLCRGGVLVEAGRFCKPGSLQNRQVLANIHI